MPQEWRLSNAVVSSQYLGNEILPMAFDERERHVRAGVKLLHRHNKYTMSLCVI